MFNRYQASRLNPFPALGRGQWFGVHHKWLVAVWPVLFSVQFLVLARYSGCNPVLVQPSLARGAVELSRVVVSGIGLVLLLLHSLQLISPGIFEDVECRVVFPEADHSDGQAMCVAIHPFTSPLSSGRKTGIVTSSSDDMSKTLLNRAFFFGQLRIFLGTSMP